MIEPCKCIRCGWTWTPRIKSKPKQCPGCKSSFWNTRKTGRNSPDMACAKCDHEFKDGETVFRFQEGTNVDGKFVLKRSNYQGLYCEECAPSEEDLPFAK